MSPVVRRRWQPSTILVLAGAAILYGVLLPKQYSGDDLQYTMVIERATLGGVLYDPAARQRYAPRSTVITPHGKRDAPSLNLRYPLEWPTSILVARAWNAVGLPGGTIVAIQSCRVLVGAIGLAFFYLAACRIGRSTVVALLCTAGLGVSAAYFTYSTHVDQSINMVALLCAALWVFARESHSGTARRRWAPLLFTMVAATFYNLTAVFSALAFAVGVAMAGPKNDSGERIRRFVTFGLAYALGVGMTLAAAVAFFVSPSALLNPSFWRAATFAGRPEYRVNAPVDAARAAIGIAKSQVLYPGLAGSYSAYFDSAVAWQRVLLLTFLGLVLLILSMPIAVLLARVRELGEERKMFLFLGTWLAVHSLFNWFWDPGFSKYWLVPLVAWWSMAIVMLAHIRARASHWYRVAVITAASFVIVSLSINFATQFFPQSSGGNNPWLTIADTLKAQSLPSDLFISPGHPLDFYVAYFARRDIVSTGLVAYDRGESPSGIRHLLAERIAAHRADHGSVYVYGLESLTEEGCRAFRAMLGDGELREAWHYPDTELFELIDTTRRSNGTDPWDCETLRNRSVASRTLAAAGVRGLMARPHPALDSELDWEIVFVDNESPDGRQTPRERTAQTDARVPCLHPPKAR